MHFFSPCARSCPRLRVRLDRVGAARQQQFDDLDSSPPTGPSERCAVEQRIADVETRARIEQNRGELNTHVVIAGNDLVQHRLPGFQCTVMRTTTGENQFETCACICLLLRVEVPMA